MNYIRRIGKLMLIGGLLFPLLPLGFVFVANILAWFGGCKVDSAAAIYPCSLLGYEIGDWLGVMHGMGWFFIPAAPLGGGLAIFGLIVIIIAAIARRFEKKSNIPD